MRWAPRFSVVPRYAVCGALEPRGMKAERAAPSVTHFQRTSPSLAPMTTDAFCVSMVYRNKTKQNDDRSRKYEKVGVAMFPWFDRSRRTTLHDCIISSQNIPIRVINPVVHPQLNYIYVSVYAFGV